MIVPYNELLYLTLIRPVFCIGAIVMPNLKYVKKNSLCKRNMYIKDALSSVRQFLATESPLKMMKSPFNFS